MSDEVLDGWFNVAGVRGKWALTVLEMGTDAVVAPEECPIVEPPIPVAETVEVRPGDLVGCDNLTLDVSLLPCCLCILNPVGVGGTCPGTVLLTDVPLCPIAGGNVGNAIDIVGNRPGC